MCGVSGGRSGLELGAVPFRRSALTPVTLGGRGSAPADLRVRRATKERTSRKAWRGGVRMPHAARERTRTRRPRRDVEERARPHDEDEEQETGSSSEDQGGAISELRGVMSE